MLNGTGGTGLRTILNRWFDALVGSSLGERLVQQADRELNAIRRAIVGSRVGALVGQVRKRC